MQIRIAIHEVMFVRRDHMRVARGRKRDRGTIRREKKGVRHTVNERISILAHIEVHRRV